MQYKEKLAVIIPTKDRPADLERLLKSISAQSVKPSQVIVVDGSSIPVMCAAGASGSVPVTYLRVIPASLTTQRNAGIRALGDDITLAAFLDDDVVLEDDSISNMLKFWEAAPENTGGAAFNNTLEKYKRPRLFEKLFLVNSDIPGRILVSGFQSRPYPAEGDMPVEWLPGYAMTFRKEVFREFLFDERFTGYARYEDVDISYRVGKKHGMFIVSDARIKHFISPEKTEFSSALGRMEVTNRLYFVKKNPELSVGLCYWALFGIFVSNIVRGIFFSDTRRLLRAKGNIAGLIFPSNLPAQKRQDRMKE